MATLTGVRANIRVQHGIDSDSRVTFQLYYLDPGSVVAFLAFSSVPDNVPITKDLAIEGNALDKNQINSTTFYLDINANGRDQFSGTLNLEFSFSDGTTAGFEYGS